jgi:predicted ATPase/signal transduction histidine kinase/ActR/RegA family two-component response regulator
MLTVTGYEILDTMYESSRSLVCRAVRKIDGLVVVLKALAKDHPPPEEIARRRHEYAILSHLSLDGVIGAYGLEENSRGPVLAIEDFGAEPLSKYAKRLPPSFSEIIRVAIRLASILGELHAAHIIHKDINPSNVVCCPGTGRLKIIDFDIAGIFSREDAFPRDPARFHGTLPYISPEQTGRTNRVVDYRTDYYGLGVTLYELLCGCLPFETSDPLELVHCHIARTPTSPAELMPGIPQALSDITMKLMAKNASERYQSSWGIKTDLEQCLNRLDAPAAHEPFPLGRTDRPTRFHVSQKVYGREKEIHSLLAAFERVSTGQKEIVLVSGDPGVGKTALAREIYEPVTRNRGSFIYGKFDQFQQDSHHFSIIDVFRQLVRQRLMESDEALSALRQELMAACGHNGRLLLDVIPELEHIIGQQPPVPEVVPVEAQNRFNWLFRSFARLWCNRDHPLVLFLDDLQWVDASSLRLLELLMTDDELRFLLVIAAYRSGNVSQAHRFMRSVTRMTSEGAVVNSVSVVALGLEQIIELLSESLGADADAAVPLADLILEKTGGNPFFVNEFLRSLYQAKLLDFDMSRGVWVWNLKQLEVQAITENIVDLMSLKIRKLQPKTQDLLKLASCIGSRFDLGLLVAVSEHSSSGIMDALREAVAEGLILALGDVWRQEVPDQLEGDGTLPVEFVFSHDRIQQIAYEMIPSEDRPALHLRMGRVLRDRGFLSKTGEMFFRVVDHLNAASHLLESEQEKYDLAELNLMAGKRAKSSTSYEAAQRYLNSGIAMLDHKSWQHHYDLTFDLHVHAAEAAYLCTDFETTEQHCQTALSNAVGDLDKVRTYDVKIQACIARYEMLDAARNAVIALRLLGADLPDEPTPFSIGKALLKTRLLLLGKKIESLIDLPEMTDPKARAALRIMSSAAKAVYAAAPKLTPLFVSHTVNLSVKHGNAPESALAYATYGVVLISLLGDIDRAYRFGELALNVAQRFGIVKSTIRPMMAVYFFIKPWKEHYRKSIQHFKYIYENALELGNSEDACHCAYFYCTCLFRTGENLVVIEQEMAAYSDVIRKLQQNPAYRLLSVFHQVVLNLLSTSPNPCRLTGKAFDEETTLPFLHKANDLSALCITYVSKLMLCYLFHDYAQAVEHSAHAAPYLEGVRSTAAVPSFYFYDSLARVALYASADKSTKKVILRTVTSNLRKMKKWAVHAPANYLHKVLLVDAERLRALGKDARAEKSYLQAIAGAKEHKYLNEEALAQELAGRFYLSRGNREKARVCIAQARHCYDLWGARAKIRHIDDTYRDLLREPSEAVPMVIEESALTTAVSSGLSLNLDLAAVIKASQAISGEIVLERLLDKLMNIVIENAGAQKGLLILESEAGLVVRAEVTTDQQEKPLRHLLPIEQCPGLSPAIVRYVARTRESVVLNDAAHHGMFISDPYIMSHRPKSIVCAALTNRRTLVGILYLENNLATDTFTADRVELLRILCSQAAISLENALLYERMEQLVEERTGQLQWSNAELRREILVRERAQKALYRAKIEAESANRAKSEFLANMSHELRTPLNAVIGFSELLQDQWPGALNEKQLRYVAQIWESGHHLLQLINDILDLAKVESGKLELRLTDVHVAALIEESVGMIRDKALQAGLELTAHVPEDLTHQVMFADHVKLRQILLNLLSNAVKFTHEGGKVNIEVSKKETLLHFVVTDTGIGIRKEDSERIFAAFEQVDSSLARRHQGTGLGLALSRSLAGLHGGRLWVESEGEGKGSSFVLEIPLDHDESYDSGIAPDRTRGHREHGGKEEIKATNTASRPTVLVVEDNEPNMRLASDLLDEAGYSFRQAWTADEGIHMALARVPDLILMDISLPGMDGLAATRILKQDPRTSDIPIVALTAHAMTGDRDKALAAGCDGYLPKPIDKSTFLAIITSFLSPVHPGDP